MRWVRIRSVLFALFVISYFFVVHVENSGVLTAVCSVFLMVMILGSAFLDRILYDPSAVFIEKPWRIMRPSAGDSFRLFISASAAALTLPAVILRRTFMEEAALFEFGIIVFGIAIYEFLRFRVERVRWNGTALDARSKFGRRASMKWANLTEVKMARFSNYVVFRDRGGQSVWVSRRMRGFSEFMRDAERYCPAEIQHEVRLVK